MEMEFLIEYGLFLVKTLTLLAAIAVVIGFVVSLSLRRRSSPLLNACATRDS